MPVVDVQLAEESQTRYLTYALSVVSSRALPDVRDGLKPVQRRILYAMANNLNLQPERGYRKSAAVVGEVLARFHPHGDAACYEAMVRMAQDFSLRYPLVDGQGNFGSLDGDSAAAYRYTEARLTSLAMEVIGDVGEETVSERDNFDQTTKEPVVLPSRVPNLLINGSAGIAVGMATSIPPHNLKEVVKALLLLLEDESASISTILGCIKGPDFPTGCQIVNSKKELKEIYETGRGAVRMRGQYQFEEEDKRRGGQKRKIIITSVPYGIDKSNLVEKIADLIIARKVPLLVDVRDESTNEVRIVLELSGEGDADKAMAYLYKNTPLETQYNVNITALIPTPNPMVCRPAQLSLRDFLLQFINFRVEVTQKKLNYEKLKLEDRIHLLEGLEKIIEVIEEVIEIVRKSKGRQDAAQALLRRFKLSEKQALFIVDLRIYQLSQTSIEEVTKELDDKRSRVKKINAILKSEKALKSEIAEDLKRISEEYGDDRRSKVVAEVEEVEFSEDEFIQHEDVIVIVTKDGWMKKIRATNDLSTTRIREGDSILFSTTANTKDALVLFSNYGNMFGLNIIDIASTSGYGEPVQKIFKCQDGEQVVAALVKSKKQEAKGKILLYTSNGLGFFFAESELGVTKKNGKRVAKITEGSTVRGVSFVSGSHLLSVSEDGYVILVKIEEVPLLGIPAKGIIIQKIPEDDRVACVVGVKMKDVLCFELSKGKEKDLVVNSEVPEGRARRGNRLINKGTPVIGILNKQGVDSGGK